MMKRKKGSREEDAWLSDDQLTQCSRADEAGTFDSPVPTQVVSNGEYMPQPQSEKQKRVEARIEELASSVSQKLGISRRQFLRGSGGMAASFLAMNEVFGRFFNVTQAEMVEPAVFAANSLPSNLFVFDDQLHVVRESRELGSSLRAIAQGPTTPGHSANPFNPEGLSDERGETWRPWNPALIGMDFEPEMFHLVQFIKDVYLDSQVTVGLLSNVTASIISVSSEERRPPKNIEESFSGEILTAAQTVGVRDFVNQIAGSTRLLAHGLLYTGVGNLDFVQYQIDEYQPDSWKGYTISYAAKVDEDPESLMRRWRLDDEQVAYPTYELITRNQARLKETRPGFGNICVHKGLAPNEQATPEIGHPADIPKAARDWPNLNFIIYHACIRPRFFMYESLQEIESGALRAGVPDISWTTEFAQLAADLPNVYAELGTTWASTVITFPTVAAHLLGQLLKFLGEDRVVFGSDSVWYGSPQWQIEALWRFEIPRDMQEKYGYPELTETAKRKILGLNSARLYELQSTTTVQPGGDYRPVPRDYPSRIPDDLKTLMESPGFRADNLTRMKVEYLAQGPEPRHTRFGWIHT